MSDSTLASQFYTASALHGSGQPVPQSLLSTFPVALYPPLAPDGRPIRRAEYVLQPGERAPSLWDVADRKRRFAALRTQLERLGRLGREDHVCIARAYGYEITTGAAALAVLKDLAERRLAGDESTARCFDAARRTRGWLRALDTRSLWRLAHRYAPGFAGTNEAARQLLGRAADARIAERWPVGEDDPTTAGDEPPLKRARRSCHEPSADDVEARERLFAVRRSRIAPWRGLGFHALRRLARAVGRDVDTRAAAEATLEAAAEREAANGAPPGPTRGCLAERRRQVALLHALGLREQRRLARVHAPDAAAAPKAAVRAALERVIEEHIAAHMPLAARD